MVQQVNSPISFINLSISNQSKHCSGVDGYQWTAVCIICILFSYILYKKSAWWLIDPLYSGLSITQTATCYIIVVLGCLIKVLSEDPLISILWLLVTLWEGDIATPFFQLAFIIEKVSISTFDSSCSCISKCIHWGL